MAKITIDVEIHSEREAELVMRALDDAREALPDYSDSNFAFEMYAAASDAGDALIAMKNGVASGLDSVRAEEGLNRMRFGGAIAS